MSVPKGGSVDQRVPKTQRLVAPSGNEPFSEWSREEKDEYARKRMEEMKLRNEKYKQRYAEVEKDRKKAEAKNSSVTSVLSLPKEKLGIKEELPDTIDVDSKPKVKEREWDRGKSLVNLEHWNNRKPDNRPDNYHQTNWKSFADKRSARKEDNWRNQNSSRFKDSGNKFSETRQNTSNYRNDGSFSKPRGRGYRSGNSYATNNNVQDSRKQPCVGNRDVHTQGPSNSEMDHVKQSGKYENDRMWRDGGMNEVKHRQIRVEKWVKSINNECLKDDGFTSSKPEKAGYQNKPWDGYNREEGNCETGPKISDSDRHPKSNWKNKSHSKQQIPADFSTTYENQAFKKQGERKPNSWRKPNIPGKGQFLDNLSKVANSSPEFEISEDIIVKIEGHTVKRTFFNYHDNTERYNEPENSTQDAWGDIQQDSDTNEQWGDIQQDSDKNDQWADIQQDSFKKDQWGKTGRWEDCKYEDENVKAQDSGVDQVHCDDNVIDEQFHSEKGSCACDNYQENETLLTSNENEIISKAPFKNQFSNSKNKNHEDCDNYQVNENIQSGDENENKNAADKTSIKSDNNEVSCKEDHSNFQNVNEIAVEMNQSNYQEYCDDYQKNEEIAEVKTRNISELSFPADEFPTSQTVKRSVSSDTLEVNPTYKEDIDKPQTINFTETLSE